MSSPTTVLLYSSVAAAAAVLGVLPFRSRKEIPGAWLGWATALAAGLMLGLAYVLAVAGLDYPHAASAAAAIFAISALYWTHSMTSADSASAETDSELRRKTLLLSTLHSMVEGIAIGVSTTVSLKFGIFMALAVAVHNVPESTVLCAIIRRQNVSLTHAGGLCVAVKSSQVVLAVLTFVALAAIPALLPWALGGAAGALVYLVMVELLPQSYQQAGHPSIALITSVAIGMVVLLKGVFA